MLEESDLKDSPLSYPKFSVWAGTLIPTRYIIFAQDDLDRIASFFNLEDYPKSGVRGFNFATTGLNTIFGLSFKRL